MYYFIVNPISGCGRGKIVWTQVLEQLKQRSIPFRSYQLRYKGEAREIAAGLSQLHHPFTAVIIGGDGTINEFIDGLSSFESITLGCIPTGSGNDFVRGLELSRDPQAALEAILHPARIRRLKVGSVRNGSRSHAFIVSAGIGFDADVCNGSYRSGTKQFLNWFHAGKLIYLATAMKLLLSMKQTRMKLTTDTGEVLNFEQTFFAAVMNLRYEGGGFMFAPEADPCDSCFQLCIAEQMTRPRILQLLPLAFHGGHVGKKGIHILSCRSVTVEAAVPRCVHTDGEIFGFFEKVTFESRPGRLSVIA